MESVRVAVGITDIDPGVFTDGSSIGIRVEEPASVELEDSSGILEDNTSAAVG